jgi:uncharacterized protein YjbI with pentapeptide repeats
MKKNSSAFTWSLIGTSCIVIIIILLPFLFPEIKNTLVCKLGFKGNTPTKDFYTSWITLFGSIGVIINLVFFAVRLKNQDRQIKLQLNANLDQRFALAVETLGNDGESARTGAIYSLYHLAMEHEKYRQTVMDILCSHIRSKTNEKEYKDSFKEEPSNEIQTTINLVFKENGLFYKHHIKLERPNLSKSFLKGANFNNSKLYDTIFTYSNLQNANFTDAFCPFGNFIATKCHGANFLRAKLYKASFLDSKALGTKFHYTQACGIDMMNANFTGSELEFSNLFRADLNNTIFDGVRLAYSFIYSLFFTNLSLLGAFTDLNTCFEDVIGRNTNINYEIFFRYYESDKKYSQIDYYNNAIIEVESLLIDPYIIKNKYNDQLSLIYEDLIQFKNNKKIDNSNDSRLKTGVLLKSSFTEHIINKQWHLIYDD